MKVLLSVAAMAFVASCGQNKTKSVAPHDAGRDGHDAGSSDAGITDANAQELTPADGPGPDDGNAEASSDAIADQVPDASTGALDAAVEGPLDATMDRAPEVSTAADGALDARDASGEASSSTVCEFPNGAFWVEGHETACGCAGSYDQCYDLPTPEKRWNCRFYWNCLAEGAFYDASTTNCDTEVVDGNLAGCKRIRRCRAAIEREWGTSDTSLTSFMPVLPRGMPLPTTNCAFRCYNAADRAILNEIGVTATSPPRATFREYFNATSSFNAGTAPGDFFVVLVDPNIEVPDGVVTTIDRSQTLLSPDLASISVPAGASLCRSSDASILYEYPSNTYPYPVKPLAEQLSACAVATPGDTNQPGTSPPPPNPCHGRGGSGIHACVDPAGPATATHTKLSSGDFLGLDGARILDRNRSDGTIEFFTERTQFVAGKSWVATTNRISMGVVFFDSQTGVELNRFPTSLYGDPQGQDFVGEVNLMCTDGDTLFFHSVDRGMFMMKPTDQQPTHIDGGDNGWCRAAAGHVYYGSVGTTLAQASPSNDRTIRKIDPYAQGVDLDGDNLFIAVQDPAPTFDIYEMPTSGATLTKLNTDKPVAAGRVIDLRVDATDVYVLTGHGIQKLSRNGGPTTALTTGLENLTFLSMALTDTDVYFTARSSGLWAVAKSGGAPRKVWRTGVYRSAVATAGGRIFYNPGCGIYVITP